MLYSCTHVAPLGVKGYYAGMSSAQSQSDAKLIDRTVENKTTEGKLHQLSQRDRALLSIIFC